MYVAKEVFDTIVNTAKDLGYEPRSYSGRAMYGKECLAIELDRYTGAGTAMTKIIAELYQNNTDQSSFEDILCILSSDDIREDSMGLGSVIYFPWIPWIDLDNEDDSDDDEESEEE